MLAHDLSTRTDAKAFSSNVARLHPDLADFHERFAPADGCSGCCPDGADHPDAPLNQHVRDLELFEGYALRTAEDDQRVDWQRERMQGRLFYDENRLLLVRACLHPILPPTVLSLICGFRSVVTSSPGVHSSS